MAIRPKCVNPYPVADGLVRHTWNVPTNWQRTGPSRSRWLLCLHLTLGTTWLFWITSVLIGREFLGPIIHEIIFWINYVNELVIANDKQAFDGRNPLFLGVSRRCYFWSRKWLTWPVNLGSCPVCLCHFCWIFLQWLAYIRGGIHLVYI